MRTHACDEVDTFGISIFPFCYRERVGPEGARVALGRRIEGVPEEPGETAGGSKLARKPTNR